MKKSNVLTLTHAYNAKETYQTPQQLFHFGGLIPTLIAQLRCDSNGKKDLNTRHGSTIPIKKQT